MFYGGLCPTPGAVSVLITWHIVAKKPLAEGVTGGVRLPLWSFSCRDKEDLKSWVCIQFIPGECQSFVKMSQREAITQLLVLAGCFISKLRTTYLCPKHLPVSLVWVEETPGSWGSGS